LPLAPAACWAQASVLRRSIAFIKARQQDVIRNILKHCGLWQ
jgi:hypothetical protein